MKRKPPIRTMLEGGDRRSLGRAEEVLELAKRDPRKIGELMKCLWDADPRVAMRAADVIEKLSRECATRFQQYKDALLELAAETMQQELRWHLAVVVPRLRLTKVDCERFSEILRTHLEDRSSIARTFAMQGLVDLLRQNPTEKDKVADLIRSLTRTGTAAMRARGRHLLKQLEQR